MSIMSQSIAKISPALLKAQKAMGDAKKDSKNPFFKSSYADLNAVREAIMPSLNAEDITVMQLNIPGPEGRMFVRTLLLHVSGEYIGSDTEIVCAKQNDPQALGSAISYARRYGLQSMLCVGAIDDDGEKAMGRQPVAPTAKPTVTKTEAKEAAPAPAATEEKAEAPKAKPSFPRPGKKTETKPATNNSSGDLF